MMAAAAGHELDADGLSSPSRSPSETDGNPFFVGEVLRSLVGVRGAARTTRRPGGGASTARRRSGLPESVRDVIEPRVERLGQETREVLTLAAVIGRSFDLELLGATGGAEESELLDQLEAAVAASLLDESPEHVGRFRFAHALINQTLYEGLGATRRARMHQRVAEALEELYGAEPGERRRACAALAAGGVPSTGQGGALRPRAGQQALDSLAPAEAAAVRRRARAARARSTDAERCEALIGLGEAQQLTGDAAYRETLLEAAQIASALGDAALAAGAALANTRGFTSLIGEVDEERVAAIERALELDDGADLGRRALLLALQSQELLYEHDPTRRQALAMEAIALTRDIADPRVRARVLQHAFHGLWSPDMVAARADLTRDLLASAQAAEDRALEAWANLLLLHGAFETGDFARARALSDRLQELAAALQQPTLSWVAQMGAAALTVVERNLVVGEDAPGRRSRSVSSPASLTRSGSSASSARSPGCIRAAVTLNSSSSAARRRACFRAWPSGRRQRRSTRPISAASEVARKLLDDAVESSLEQVGWDTLRLVALSFYADAASRLHAVDAAALVHELMSPWGDQVIWGGAQAYGHVRLWLGVAAATIGRDDEADEAFAFACRFHDDNGLMLWSARSHLGWAEALADRGENARAQEHATRALELAHAHGYGLIAALAAPIAGVEALAND